MREISRTNCDWEAILYMFLFEHVLYSSSQQKQRNAPISKQNKDAYVSTRTPAIVIPGYLWLFRVSGRIETSFLPSHALQRTACKKHYRLADNGFSSGLFIERIFCWTNYPCAWLGRSNSSFEVSTKVGGAECQRRGGDRCYGRLSALPGYFHE